MRPPADDWWDAADLLFVGFDSTKESVLATADRIRAKLKDFYPSPHQDMVVNGGYAVREDWDEPYQDLVIVGHSLGGLVTRRVLVDALDEWKVEKFAPDLRPAVLYWVYPEHRHLIALVDTLYEAKDELQSGNSVHMGLFLDCVWLYLLSLARCVGALRSSPHVLDLDMALSEYLAGGPCNSSRSMRWLDC